MSILTVKGQVTIPKRIRDQLGLKPGSTVRFEPAADGSVRILPARRRTASGRFAALHGRLRGKARTDALLSELRGYDEDALDPGLKRSWSIPASCSTCRPTTRPGPSGRRRNWSGGPRSARWRSTPSSTRNSPRVSIRSKNSTRSLPASTSSWSNRSARRCFSPARRLPPTGGAAVLGVPVLTRDTRRYRSLLPRLVLIAP